MGVSCSKLEDDKSLILCRHRKHFIRQAIDCRCALAATHVAYIHSLRSTGTSLRKFVQPELHSESSPYTTSNSATPEPLSSTENSVSQSSNSSLSASQHVETSDVYSPITSRVDSMQSGNINSRNVEEKPPISQRVEQSEAACTPPWDYFNSFSPIDRKRSLLEDEGEKSFGDERDSDDNFVGMDDEFDDDSSSEILVKMHRNINETSNVTPTMATSSVVSLSVDGKYREFGSEAKVRTKDFFSCVKEIEDLFLKAYESGREIPRMLEANKIHFRPLFREGIAYKSKISTYLNAWFTCCTEEPIHSQAPLTTNEVKYLTWHRSASSLSSSSRFPLGPTSKNEADDIGSNLFGSICMNSGSHASTLDRLYAWERKLYDEIKVSGIIRSEYDMKCKLLRDQDSRDEHAYRIERTRASVKDLHYRIRVAIHRIDSISKGIEEIRDKELQPQLEELIEGLTKMWRAMLDYHTNQYNIITSTSYIGSAKLSSMRLESHKQATILLQAELNSLFTNFAKWMSSHKSYLESINVWLLKCIFLTPPTRQRFSRKKTPPFSPRRSIAPPIFVTCRDWLKLIEGLPTKEVEEAITDLIDITTHFMPRLEKGHGTKRGGLSYEELHATESAVDWMINYDSLQSGLVVLLDKLKSFAEKSVVMYEELQKAIAEARVAYDGDDEFVAR